MGRPLYGSNSSSSHANSCTCVTCLPTTADPDSVPITTGADSTVSFPMSESVGGAGDLGSSLSAANLQLYAQTRENLRLASSALDAAYDRLRELRTAMRVLSSSSESSSMGPGHAAIVLSGGELEDNTDVVDSVASDTVSSQSSSYLASQDMSPLSTTPSSRLRLLVSSPPLSSPSSQDPSPTAAPQISSNTSRGRVRTLRSRRSILEDHLRLRRDDSLTAIGRRAAARAAGGVGSTSTTRSDETQTIIHRTIQVANDLEHTIDRYLANRRTLSTTLSNVLQRSAAPRRRQDLDAERSESLTSDTASAASSRAPAVLGQRGTIRPRLAGPRSASNVAPFNSQRSDGPAIAAASLAQGTQHLQESTTNDTGASEPSFQRSSYELLRRLSAGATVRSNSYNTDDSDDAFSWLLPNRNLGDLNRAPGRAPSRVGGGEPPALTQGTMSSGEDEAAQEGLSADMRSSPRRRRGWARLDSDGNEIPTDEEEELERTRTQVRIRVTSAVQTTLVPPEQPTVSEISLVPTTRNSISHGSEEETRNARVRLNPPQRRHPLPSRWPWYPVAPPPISSSASLNPPPTRARSDRAPSPMNSPNQCSVEEGLIQTFGSAAPYYMDPLPMPLEEMVYFPLDRREGTAAELLWKARISQRPHGIGR